MRTDQTPVHAKSSWSSREFSFAAIAGLAWFALGLQLLLTLSNPAHLPGSLAERLNNLLSYFTIWTNFLIAATLTVMLGAPHGRLALRLRTPEFLTGVAVAISLVSIAYELLLRGLWKPSGWSWVADTLFHDVVPAAFVLLWLVFVPKGNLGPRHLPAWLIYPTGYFAYVLLRGVVVGRYPYPFWDVTLIGYTQTVINALGLLLVVIVLGGVFLVIDRLMASAAPLPRATSRQ
jgi:hypothetical protein